MFTKEEMTAVLQLLNRQGIKVDISEVEAISFLKRRFNEELMKANNPKKVSTDEVEKKAVDASAKAPIIKPKVTKQP
jgi:hypothetical protein